LFSLQFVLVKERFEVWVRTAVYTERFVVGACYNALGPERSVLQEDARAWVVLPVEGRVGMAFTFHVCFSFSVAKMLLPHRLHSKM
jgi:hypothetical protein